MSVAQTITASSFGGANTTYGPGSSFRGKYLIDSPRYRELDRRQAYFDCTQHDYKNYDFDGRVISTGSAQGAGFGASITQPLLTSERASFFVPLRARRPSAPVRLARLIVSSFTNLLFGENRFPQARAQGDAATQDFSEALLKAARAPAKFIEGRNLGGSTGTAAFSWCFINGVPRIETHNAKNLFVHSWADREQLVPRHVTEAYLFPKDTWDGQKRAFVRKLFWYRRDWTPVADILFNEVEFKPQEDPADLWLPDPDRTVEHGDNLTHFEWVQNLPSQDVDGLPDYEGQYETLDTLDLLMSVVTRGAALNLDPTLKLKMDPDLIQRAGVKKGSDNALIVGEGGDAEYMELTGQSIEAGLKLFADMRRMILEACQCVLPDPDKVAAQGVSAVAMRTVYAPMLGRTDTLREQYGTPLRRMLQNMTQVARAAGSSGKSVSLPPRVEQIPPDPGEAKPGEPPGEPKIRTIERDPGEAEHIELSWGPYFYPTPTDQQMIVQTMAQATANQPVLSQQTSVELAARFLGLDPTTEWTRVQHSASVMEQKQSQMFADADGGAGGKVSHTQELPGGASVTKTAGGPKPAPPGGGKDKGDGGYDEKPTDPDEGV
jgi:hypothetical protein